MMHENNRCPQSGNDLFTDEIPCNRYWREPHQWSVPLAIANAGTVVRQRHSLDSQTISSDRLQGSCRYTTGSSDHPYDRYRP
jgi:hypothetical protein